MEGVVDVVEVRFREVVIDCADPPALARFWAGFTGYAIRHESDEWTSIGTADARMIIGFQQVPEGKAVKNRVHLDFAAVDEETTALAIEAEGAKRLWVSDDPKDPFVVLADPEGNEFCIVRDD